MSKCLPRCRIIYLRGVEAEMYLIILFFREYVSQSIRYKRHDKIYTSNYFKYLHFFTVNSNSTPEIFIDFNEQYPRRMIVNNSRNDDQCFFYRCSFRLSYQKCRNCYSYKKIINE